MVYYNYDNGVYLTVRFTPYGYAWFNDGMSMVCTINDGYAWLLDCVKFDIIYNAQEVHVTLNTDNSAIMINYVGV